jgi:hypothetical protein
MTYKFKTGPIPTANFENDIDPKPDRPDMRNAASKKFYDKLDQQAKGIRASKQSVITDVSHLDHHHRGKDV